MGRIMLVRSGADLGAAVAEARRLRGETQERVAAHLALERSYLARMETGATVLFLDRALRVLRHLGAEVVVQLPEPVTDQDAPAPAETSARREQHAAGGGGPSPGL